MDIYDSRYFNINKTLLRYVGLWPYGNQIRNRFIRIYSLIMVAIMALPHVLGLRTQFGVDTMRFLENVGVLLYIGIVFLKLFTTSLAEKKFKVMYDDIRRNWDTITEKNERSILIEYSERGRLLTIVYITYMIAALLTFVTLPLIPVVLNKLKPLNESRPYIFILNGEFLVDRDENFGKIYVFDILTCSTSIFVILAVDTMYATCTEHCIGLFAIVKYYQAAHDSRYRLQLPNKLAVDEYSIGLKKQDESYKWMVETIRLHNKILKFTNTIETTYSTSFLVIMGINILYFGILSVLILVNLNKPVNSIRYSALMIGLMVHLFYLSWPGQKLIDHSTGLFRDAYCNEWYEGSVQSKRLLRFFTLRCSEPCLLTAGGLVTMNMENFMMIMKKSMSYITVFSSFR